MMPIVELDIGGKPVRVQVSDGFTPEDLDYIVKNAGTQTAVSGESETTTPTSRPMGPVEKAGAYVTKRGGQFIGALGRLTTPRGLERPVLEQLGDVATVAGPVIAPGLTAAGLAAGGAASALGADESTAELADIATNVGGGLGMAVRGGIGAARSAKDITEEGARLRELVPGMRQAVSGERKALFDPIVSGLQKMGRTIKVGTPEGNKLGQGLLDVQEDWGSNRAVRMVLEKLTKIGEVSPEDVDQALAVANQMGKSFATRSVLKTALDDLARGTPAEGQLTAAGKEYFKQIKPAQHMANAVGKANTPGMAALTAIREWKRLAPSSQRLLDPTGEVAAIVKSASKGARGSMALAGGMASMGGIAFASQRLLEGDVKGAFITLLASTPLMAMRMPGVVGAAARGAVPGLARGALGAAATAVPTLQNAPGTPNYSPPVQDLQTDEEAPGAPQEPTPVSGPPAAAETPQGPLGRELAALSRLTGVPVNLAKAVMRRESHGQPGLVSPQGAVGLMQLLPGTFNQLKPKIEALTWRRADINDNLDNLAAGFLYLKEALDATGGDVAAAARYYHGGPNLRMHGPKTQAYGQAIAQGYGQ